MSFTTQTALANTNTITITLPTNYISGTIGVKVPTGFTATNTGTLPQVIFAASAAVAAGAYTVTLTGATIGGPVPAGSGSVACSSGDTSVSTSTDLSGSVNSLQLGGQVQGVSVTCCELRFQM